MSKLLIFLAVAAVAWCPLGSSKAQLVDEELTLEEVFRYSDLVVQGIIEKITKVTVTWQDISPKLLARQDVPMAIMDFRIDTVLIGYQTARHLEVVAYNFAAPGPYHFDLVEGNRYILDLRVPATTGRVFEGGRYLAGSRAGEFLITGSAWSQGNEIKPMAEGQLKELYAILEKVQRDRSVERLTEQAELIVRGEVLDVWEGKEKDARGFDKHITRVKLVVQSVMKGAILGDSVVVSMISRGFYEPSWRAQVPDIHKGEEWIMFLKYADEPGYYPFAGVNGLFLVEGDVLIRNNNNRIVLPFSRKQLDAEVNQAVRGGE